jgi:hypothetical protein
VKTQSKPTVSGLKLLSVGSDAKTVKGNKFGYLTGIMYLAPFDTAGIKSKNGNVINVCSHASGQCAGMCLNSAGRAGMFKTIQDARKRKTELFYFNRSEFLSQLRTDILRLIAYSQKNGFIPAVRLNGTSDLNWEHLAVELMNEFSDVQFYDYTKVPSRYERYLKGSFPKNYHLTFSRSEVNHNYCIDLLELSIVEKTVSVAVVFDIRPGNDLPKFWNGFPVIDGDESDLRFLDQSEFSKNFIVGLRAKGKARKTSRTDISSFVIAGFDVPK